MEGIIQLCTYVENHVGCVGIIVFHGFHESFIDRRCLAAERCQRVIIAGIKQQHDSGYPSYVKIFLHMLKSVITSNSHFCAIERGGKMDLSTEIITVCRKHTDIDFTLEMDFLSLSS